MQIRYSFKTQKSEIYDFVIQKVMQLLTASSRNIFLTEKDMKASCIAWPVHGSRWCVTNSSMLKISLLKPLHVSNTDLAL